MLINVLIDLKKVAVTSDREETYLKCREKFERYLSQRADNEYGHTRACFFAAGDVVDTCPCHYYTHVYPRELMRECLDAYFLYKPYDPATKVYNNQITEDPKKSVFQRFITCFFSCRASDVNGK